MSVPRVRRPMYRITGHYPIVSPGVVCDFER
jgi:hypothetical protein